MAWTIKVAALCVLGNTIVAKKKYQSPLQVFQEPKDIKSLFKNGKTYYVEAGTIKKGPEQFPRYDLYCGEVLVKRNRSTITIRRRYLYPTRDTWSCACGNSVSTLVSKQYLRSFVQQAYR
uniref:Putative salivary lipocalin n=1 Tax=Ixodes ricinus TaxID=34613 RepID=A0A6B0UNH2_IXORI